MDNQNQRDECQRKIYLISYFVMRYVLGLMTLFLSFVASMYGISNLITMEAVNFFCGYKTAKEVYEHNRALNISTGIEDDCWYINKLVLNADAIKNLNLNIYNASIITSNDVTFERIVSFILFIILAMILLCGGMLNIYYIIYDTVYFVILKKPNPRIKNIKVANGVNEPKSSNDENYNVKQNRCISCWKKYKQWRIHNYYKDSKYRIFGMISGEIIETLVQLIGLCIFGGINIFSSNSVVLSQEHYVVESFAIIVGLNGIVTGLAWMMYIIWHNTWNGALFVGLIFFIDTTFEVLYTLFPLIYLTTGDTIFDLKSLGLLQQSDAFAITQTLLPSIFLARKCLILLKELNPSTMQLSYLILQKRIQNGNNIIQKPWILTQAWMGDIKIEHHAFQDKMKQTIRNELQFVSHSVDVARLGSNSEPARVISRSPSVSKTDNIEITDNIEKTEKSEKTEKLAKAEKLEKPDTNCSGRASIEISDCDENYKTNVKDVKHGEKGENIDNDMKNQKIRKIIVFLMGLIIFGLGLSIMISFVTDIEYNYKNKCISGSDDSDFYLDNPEVSTFYLNNSDTNYCTRKVVNIFNEYPCNCRQFRLIIDSTSDNRLSILPNVFKKWRMLEGVYLHSNRFPATTNAHLNFNESMLELPYLRSLVVERINVGTIDDDFGNLVSNLEILLLQDMSSQLHFPWKSINKLSKLKALRFREIEQIVTPMDDSICDLPQLRFFEIRGANIVNTTVLPSCLFNKLYELRSFDLSRMESGLTQIDSQLFLLPNIEQIRISRWNFNISSFYQLNGYSNTLRRVELGYSNVCDNYNESLTWLDYIGLSNDQLRLFIERFDPCFEPCNSNINVACEALGWGDGVCDLPCFNQACGYDNGDCNQLCDCIDINDENDYVNMSLLVNNVCNDECDNDLCLNDLYECNVDVNATCNNDSNDNNTCYDLWTQDDDGWCDNNCRYQSECNYDNHICDSCTSNCELLYEIGIRIAGVYYPSELATIDEACEESIFQAVSLSKQMYTKSKY